MNLVQLRIKRFRELLASVRVARHLVHATRVPLGRAVRLARAGERKVWQAQKRLTAVEDTDEFNWSVDVKEIAAWYHTEAENLAELEKAIVRRLRKLERKPEASDAQGQTKARRKQRKASARRGGKALGKKLQAARSVLEERIRDLNAKITTVSELEAINAARRGDDFYLVSATGTSNWPESRRKEFREVLAALRALQALESQEK